MLSSSLLPDAACLEHNPERPLIVACARDSERPNLLGRSHMLANARADVEVADAHDAQSLARILWQLVELHPIRYIVARHELVGNGQVLCDEFVHLCLNLCHLISRRLLLQVVVDLRFLSFDVSILRPLAAKHPHHHLVEQMLGSMRRTMLILVVLIQHYFAILFHCQIPS